MANWTYFLAYSPKVGTYEKVRAFLNSRPEIEFWACFLPNTFFITSDKTAPQLGEIFRKFTKDRARFVILDTKTDRSGWLPESAWKLMKDPNAIPE